MAGRLGSMLFFNSMRSSVFNWAGFHSSLNYMLANLRIAKSIQEPSVTSVLATIFDKKPSRKKANVRKDQKKEVENVPSLQDVQTGGSQLQCPPGIFVRPITCAHFILKLC